MTPLELILCEIPEKIQSLRSALNARGDGASLRLAGKNFPPQTPPIFARSPKLGNLYDFFD